MQLLFKFENEYKLDCIVNDILNEWAWEDENHQYDYNNWLRSVEIFGE